MGEENIFKQLREESDELRETPSPKAWDRLERRLDHRRVQKHRKRFSTSRSFISMVASFALLIGMVGVFMWLGKAEQTKMATPAAAIAADQPMELEDLTVPAEIETTGTTKLIVPAKQASYIPQKEIVEGSRPEQKLVAKTTRKPSDDGRSSFNSRTGELDARLTR